MAYAKPVSKHSPRKPSASVLAPGPNGRREPHVVTVPPPTVTHVRSPTPEEIIDNLRFMFAVGIECSNPTIEGGVRVDELEATGHYEHWKTDLQLVRDLGLRYLRYGPPIHRLFTGAGQYHWEILDPVMEEMQRLGIRPIIDLVHFGLPDWLVNFQNPDWPHYLAEYAAAFCKQYPWVRFFTPVNEIFVTAQFSGAFGWWNERLKSDQAFVTNLKHCVKASMLTMREILRQRPDAIFIFSESTEYVHPGSPKMVPKATFLNERRFLSLDLLFGHDVSATMYQYLLHSGMTSQEYQWYREQSDLRSHCIMGTDYYITNEHVIRDDATTIGAGDVYGYYVITRQYFDRYRLPVMHTETNRASRFAVEWLWKEWMNLLRLREDGVPIVGFTWFGLVDMKDWDSALTKMRGHVNPVGLYTLGRRPRKVAREFAKMVENFNSFPISSSKFPILTS
ncbi:MAG TPA: family 1 glycosylhydrolase [Tepidisphaeraceae bacterium]|jgi:beta-glucosidase/6-phospho-beta-glucosidase/beta-galactosidase|nr:family 1 glycosylhydrolase [Tepidisphaeraceae bacterium]